MPVSVINQLRNNDSNFSLHPVKIPKVFTARAQGPKVSLSQSPGPKVIPFGAIKTLKPISV